MAIFPESSLETRDVRSTSERITHARTTFDEDVAATEYEATELRCGWEPSLKKRCYEYSRGG
eukprot:CAMPEP_0183362386 /NCGR_PEP_ID=MMETSP0164_2-20130417/69108_1 /TAXON_ID=221442 /ORGANISM="Coccolithus pelagicus ssp braarudi, Strain PLY182g" /LENGTH=61 /DNA_ID=CAMNT_0025537251 /DNA_START=92 /DNA_END=273 /DNA_ORIENTATION=-